MRAGKFFRKRAQIVLSDLGLMLEYFSAELAADFRGYRIEIAGDNCRLRRPRVLREREIVTDHRDLVGARGLLHQRMGARAIGALQIFKYDERDLRALGRTKRGRVLSAGNQGPSDRQNE